MRILTAVLDPPPSDTVLGRIRSKGVNLDVSGVTCGLSKVHFLHQYLVLLGEGTRRRCNCKWWNSWVLMQKQCSAPANKYQTSVSPAAGSLLFLPLFSASHVCSEVACLSPGQSSGYLYRGFSQYYSVLPGKCKVAPINRPRSFLSFEATEVALLNNIRFNNIHQFFEFILLGFDSV
jgi:hypothetical protein